MREVKVEGLRELKAALNALSQNVATNVLRGAVNAGARAIRDEAKIKAPVVTGRLKRAIYTKYIREQSDPRELEELPDGGVVRRLRSSSIEFVVQQVLRHAPHAEVLGPPEARAAVAETCAALARAWGRRGRRR